MSKLGARPSAVSEGNVEAGGILSHAGSTFFGEEVGSHSLLTPGHGPGHFDSSSPSLMAKSLLGKLAIRKPSILSIASNLSSPGANGSSGENKFGGSLENMGKGKYCFSPLFANVICL